MTNILILNWRDIENPSAGGAEVFTHEIAKRWAKCGHSVTLFTSRFQGSSECDIIDQVNVVRRGNRFTVYFKAYSFYKKNKGKYDVVIDEINGIPFFTPLYVERKKVALIHQTGGGFWEKNSIQESTWFYELPIPFSIIAYFAEPFPLMRYVDVPTITVSKSTKQDLVNLGFNRVFIVPEGLNFTPLAKIPPKESFPTIAFAGRLNRAKRPDHAIQAFKVVKEKIPDTKLWIIGDGYLRKNLEKIGSGGVKFFGGLSDEERRELVKRAWVLVNPSVREGFGLNIIEANALGTPCVAYDVPGLRDSVRNNETGLLVEAGKVVNLANKIITVLENDTLRKRLSRNSLDYSRRFTWDKTADTFLKVIRCTSNGG